MKLNYISAASHQEKQKKEDGTCPSGID